MMGSEASRIKTLPVLFAPSMPAGTAAGRRHPILLPIPAARLGLHPGTVETSLEPPKEKAERDIGLPEVAFFASVPRPVSHGSGRRWSNELFFSSPKTPRHEPATGHKSRTQSIRRTRRQFWSTPGRELRLKSANGSRFSLTLRSGATVYAVTVSWDRE
jgi:hypothetical protein